MNLDMKVMNTSIDNVGNSEYFGTTVINWNYIERADYSVGLLAAIQFRMFHLSISHLKHND
jgi:hypothetical protein